MAYWVSKAITMVFTRITQPHFSQTLYHKMGNASKSCAFEAQSRLSKSGWVTTR